MKKLRLFKSILVLLLCMALVLPYLPISADAAALGNFDTSGDFSGVKLSLIGDSISTYYGVSNSSTYNPLYLSTSEATFGTYYGNTSHGDYAEFSDVKRADTWWQQTVDTLGMDLLVNNAWSGSFTLVDTGQSNTTEYPAAGYKTRSVNLHKGTTKPDIICVYMGTNDVAYYGSQNVGTKANIDTATERNALYTSVNNYKTPSTAIEAYYIMISRMIATYPDAEIYCMLPTICLNAMGTGRINALNNFNNGVRYIVDHYAGGGKNIYLVDLPEYSGLVDQETVRSYYYCNNVHPSVAGMDWITSCVVSEILEHSKKGKQNSEICDVTYDLDSAFVKTGLPRKTVVGKPFTVDLLPYANCYEIDVTVTMKDASGNEVVIPGGGDSGEGVYIPEVTGDISITAKGDSNDSFAWEAHSDAFVPVPGNGYTYNNISLLAGTYTANGDAGTMSDVQYLLNEAVVLKHDKPWVLEWKSGGNTYAGGIMLLNHAPDSSADGNVYIHITQSNVFFGYRDSVGYNNSGVAWTTIAQKLGSTAGADIRKEMLKFKVVNVPNGTNNKLWLYVNGVQIGTMDSSKMIGADASHASVGSINLSGKDFVFHYLGSATHSWNNCNISYIRAYENGAPEPDTSFADYRWEPSDGKLVSLEDDTFTENVATKVTGTVSGKTFSSATFKLDKDVVLMHDKSWTIEWASSGSWAGDRNGSFLLGTVLDYKANGAHYIFRQGGSDLIGIGEWANGIHNNYGIGLDTHGIDGIAYHKYTLKNEPVFENNAWVSNMVYLYVDDVKIGPMNNYYPSGDPDGTTSDWLNGRDLVFGAIGNSSFTLGGCELEYLQINTGCSHSYGSWKNVTAATCTAEGLQERTCSQCGDVESRSVSATGHSYTAETFETNCQTYAHTCYTCSICGDSYNTYPDEVMSPWQTTKPNVDSSMIETATEYRYSEYETLTSYETELEGYEQIGSTWELYDDGVVSYVNSWPSGFSKTSSLYNKYNNKSQKVTASVSATTKTVINSDKVAGYLYYHWCYTDSYYSVAASSGSYTTFHAYYDTTDPGNFTCDTSDMSYKTSHSSCSNSEWFFVTQVYEQSYSTYRNLYTYGRWGTPSAWTRTPMESTDERQVETRTVYRYVTGELGAHSYSGGYCTVCGEKKPNVEYYLFGYINGTNYGCEEDYENLGSYKFRDGQLTVRFDQDSYVAVKTGDNAGWYMTDGWQGTDVTSVTLYNTEKGIAADKLFVPGNVDLIFTLVENSDDTLTLSYQKKVCEHSYTSKVTTAAGCTSTGVKTYTCSKCGDSYTEQIAAVGHTMKGVATKPTCTKGGYTTYTCSVCGYSYQDNVTAAAGHSYSSTIVPNTCTQAGHTLHTCAACGHSYTDEATAATGHSYVEGVCENCGEADPDYAVEYYLFGYINGANYACEEDFENMGQYKFVDGKLVATFTADSYVGVKTSGNANWYMTNGWQGTTVTSVTLFNSNSDIVADKFFVPGNVELTFTLTVNADDTLTLSYVKSQCDHSYISEVTTAATCTTAGVKTFTCSVCGDSYEETIPATGHKYSGGACTVCGALDPDYVVTDTGYVLVTDISQITSGGKFVIVAETAEGYKAMSTAIASGKFAGVDVTVANRIVTGTNLPVWTVEAVDGGIAISIDGSYLTYNSSTNFKLVADTPYTFAVSEGYQLTATAANRGLYYSNSAAKFGAYATSNATNSGYIANLQLYKYQVGTQGCAHSYTAKVTTAATCTTAGVKTFTCSLCGHSYTEAIAALGHNYVNGTCSNCGAADPNAPTASTYYLVGYINGANYGCEEDYENMGQYKFMDGKLVATFTADSYVFLKTEGNGKWLMADSYCTDTTCTFSEGKSEKLFVPGNKQITFTLTENSDGSVTLSYTAAAAEPSVAPTLTLKYPTVSFEDVIVMNVYYTAANLEDVAEMGLITYSSNVSQWNIENAEEVIPGYSYAADKKMYVSSTNGIAAKCLGDTLYFAVYAKLADGTYTYTKLVSYSPETYAYSQLSTGAADIKPLVVAMLKYGAAAQTFFNHNTDALVDRNLTAAQLALIEDYRADMMTAVANPSAAKQGKFVANGGITRKYPTVSFEGAFEINYYCIPANTPVNGVTMYYWNQADYDAASVLTAENATAAVPMNGTGTYQAAVKGIAAKDLDKGIYVAFVYSDGTTTYSSGVLAYSIGTYCNASVYGNAGDLAKATAVYGYHAKLAFYKAV